jgi:hypothetical protein
MRRWWSRLPASVAALAAVWAQAEVVAEGQAEVVPELAALARGEPAPAPWRPAGNYTHNRRHR